MVPVVSGEAGGDQCLGFVGTEVLIGQMCSAFDQSQAAGRATECAGHEDLIAALRSGSLDRSIDGALANNN